MNTATLSERICELEKEEQRLLEEKERLLRRLSDVRKERRGYEHRRKFARLNAGEVDACIWVDVLPDWIESYPNLRHIRVKFPFYVRRDKAGRFLIVNGSAPTADNFSTDAGQDSHAREWCVEKYWWCANHLGVWLQVPTGVIFAMDESTGLYTCHYLSGESDTLPSTTTINVPQVDTQDEEWTKCPASIDLYLVIRTCAQ